MLCTNGHNNADSATACRICGVDTFGALSLVVKATSEYNGLAIASMVLGILWLYGVGAILALVFGYRAKLQIARTGQRGAGMATAGIVLGWVGVVGFVLTIVFVGAFFHTIHIPPCQVNCSP